MYSWRCRRESRKKKKKENTPHHIIYNTSLTEEESRDEQLIQYIRLKKRKRSNQQKPTPAVSLQSLSPKDFHLGERLTSFIRETKPIFSSRNQLSDCNVSIAGPQK